jgi:hypothetical protein
MLYGRAQCHPDSFSDGSTLGRESKAGSDHSSFEVDLDKVLERAEEMVVRGRRCFSILAVNLRDPARRRFLCKKK